MVGYRKKKQVNKKLTYDDQIAAFLPIRALFLLLNYVGEKIACSFMTDEMYFSSIEVSISIKNICKK